MELQQKLEEMGKAFDAFKKTNDEKLELIEKKQAVPADLEEKWNKNQDHMDKLEGQINELKAALNRTGGHGGDEAKKNENAEKMTEYKNAIKSFMRKGHDVPQELLDFAKKEMSIDSDADGGFFVSPEMSSEVSKKIFESSPVRQLASVQQIGTDMFEILYDGDEVDCEWVGETETRSESGTPQVQMIKIPVHEMASNPKATQRLLDDAKVNIEAWLAGKVSSKFSRKEATAFISGNGSKKPKGILSYASATEGFNKVQVQRTADATAIDGDDLIDVQGLLKEPYQVNASWLINRLVVKEIRKLKDTNTGQYIWQPGLTAGQPNQLLDKPVYFATDMASSLAIDNFTAIYGDIREGYQIVDRVGIRVLRDPYTAKPFVKFYTTKRVGGGVKNFEAMKILQQKNS